MEICFLLQGPVPESERIDPGQELSGPDTLYVRKKKKKVDLLFDKEKAE